MCLVTRAQKSPWTQYPFQHKELRGLLLTPKQTATLRGFGSAFLGPILYAFFKNLSLYINNNPKVIRLNFLAREGYLLGQFYNALADTKRIKALKSNYILCSRTLLFKLSLIDRPLWIETLKHHFNGSIEQLLLQRYQFNITEVASIRQFLPSGSNYFERHISLPADQDIVLEFLNLAEESIREIVLPKHRAYLTYLTSIGLRKKSATAEHIVDIGYSGTIQKLLSAQLPNTELHGHYFITTKAAQNTETNKFLGHLLSDIQFGDGHTLLDRSLYIETLLTAPHGQVIDLETSAGGIAFKFGRQTKAQAEFYKIEAVLDGALDYVKIAFDNNLDWHIEDIESFYSLLINNTSILPKDLRDVFEIDDSISGLGTLNPIKFFGQ